MTYYKITNESENHNNLQYQDGLVEDIIPFAQEGSCCEGGIYFSDEKNILEFLDYGVFIRRVEIPNDSQMVKDPEGGKWRASKVFLHPRKDLREVSTWKFLIESGINVHAKDDEALRVASCYGQLELVKVLLKAGANIHARDDDALRVASKNGYLEVVKVLLEAKANVHAQDNYALRLASLNGQLEVVKVLLEAGADVHAREDYALRYASKNGHLEVVKVLLKAGVKTS
jgi:tRNA threonylcarbamoyladenosine modification (KEOPS) complex  Pcc1 subunit